MARDAINLAVLVSGDGRTLQNFIDEIDATRLDAHIATVISSKQNAGAIARAKSAKLDHHVVDRAAHADCASFSKAVFDIVDNAGVDLVCMAGWLCLTEVPWRYDARVMNIHPALLPDFGGEGMYGKHVHEAVLAAGSTVSGCTVHFVDHAYDTGPIILQRVCPVLPNDTAEKLAERVFEEEKIAYPQAVKLFAEGKLIVAGSRVMVRAE